MILNDLILKYSNYLILSYILTIIGIIIYPYISYIPSIIFLILIATISSICFLSLLATNLFKIDDDKNEFIEFKFYKWHHIKTLKDGSIATHIKYLKLVTAIALILIPLINGNYCYALKLPSSQSYLNLICFAFETTLIYTIPLRGEIFQHDYVTSSRNTGFIFLALLLIMQPIGLNLLNTVLNYMITNLPNAFTILIAIIMLCIGLSALSFSYCSILKNNTATWKNMKVNGEGYFIASILSMIAILLLFITSIMKQHVIFMTLPHLNILSSDFIILNIYSVFVIIIFISAIYASYCMLKCSISSLQELKLFEKII